MADQTKNQNEKMFSYKQYLFGLLISRNVKKTPTDQRKQQVVLLWLKRKNLQRFKKSSWENSFSHMFVIGKNCFNGCFFSFYVMTGRHVLQKFLVTLAFFSASMFLLSLKQIFLKNHCILRYLHNTSTILIPKI